jgi:hypothetical protein
MMNTFKTVFPHSLTPSGENKRPATDTDTNDNSQSDKRQNVRSTPGKKFFTEYMDLEDPALSHPKQPWVSWLKDKQHRVQIFCPQSFQIQIVITEELTKWRTFSELVLLPKVLFQRQQPYPWAQRYHNQHQHQHQRLLPFVPNLPQFKSSWNILGQRLPEMPWTKPPTWYRSFHHLRLRRIHKLDYTKHKRFGQLCFVLPTLPMLRKGIDL